MLKSDLFPALDDIIFANKEPDTITREIISLYESTSGRSLARSDPVRLFIDAIILEVIQLRSLIDFAAKQNLLAYASGNFLEHLGALLGVTRLPPAHAVTTLTFTLKDGTRDSDSIIPIGTRVQAGKVTFATTEEAKINAGNFSSGLVTALCTEAGEIGNGFEPGQVRKLVDVLPFSVNVVNLSVTNGGTDKESDEGLRERIQIAPESFSTAGPKKAYEFFARSADSDIIDVAVIGPDNEHAHVSPGHVHIYPLMTDGQLPSDEILARVMQTCNASNVRPDTDYLQVLRPDTVDYTLDVTFWIDQDSSATSSYIQAAVEQAVDEWIAWQRKSLGRDINPSELIRLMVNAGAKRVDVSSPTFRVLNDWELAICASSSVKYAGLEKG